MTYTEYRNIVVEPELGVDAEVVADETMNRMAKDGWQVVSVCQHVRAGKLLVTFGRDRAK